MRRSLPSAGPRRRSPKCLATTVITMRTESNIVEAGGPIAAGAIGIIAVGLCLILLLLVKHVKGRKFRVPDEESLPLDSKRGFISVPQTSRSIGLECGTPAACLRAAGAWGVSASSASWLALRNGRAYVFVGRNSAPTHNSPSVFIET
ncbi:hypothetical protein QBC46DRAFT_451407 [Diplogelasinospora grovesii]|uniref:Uncharacterized protein n=1 Tax=Diplogelasinospora grovesii TaxID=303347 RepID=A0AAN6N2T1_9PEZI|nr:hypothetical protein QBC46DRAFT_451407 [Diplogelasinospora grovesii]